MVVKNYWFWFFRVFEVRFLLIVIMHVLLTIFKSNHSRSEDKIFKLVEKTSAENPITLFWYSILWIHFAGTNKERSRSSLNPNFRNLM